jgi:amino acid transporter
MNATVTAAPTGAIDSIRPEELRRTVTWKSSLIVSLGGSLLVATSLGPMAAELGPASVFVWTLMAIVGVLQCLMLAELAAALPHKSGGTAVYAHEAFRGRWRLIGAASSWGYWLGWIPVIPVNMILVAGYLKATIMPNVSTVQMATALTILLYVVNYFGLKPGVWSSIAMAVFSLLPLSAIALSPMFRPSLFHTEYVSPFVPLHGSWSSGASWLLLVKWMFVAAWSAYAFEAATTVVAELREPGTGAPRAVKAASAVGLFAFGLVPFMLLAIIGTDAITADPSVAFLPAAQAIFGHTGAVVVTIMLVCALLLGVQTTIIGSTRCVYEMSRDGLMLKQFGAVNRFNVPVGSMYLDCAVTIALLLIFKDNIVNLIAASNVGYISVFILLSPAYIVLRLRRPDMPRPFKLPQLFVPIAAAIFVFNVLISIVGGPQLGASTMLTGIAIMLLGLPLYFYRTRVQDKRAASQVAAPHAAA